MMCCVCVVVVRGLLEFAPFKQTFFSEDCNKECIMSSIFSVKILVSHTCGDTVVEKHFKSRL